MTSKIATFAVHGLRVLATACCLLAGGQAAATTVSASPGSCTSGGGAGQDWSRASRAVSSDDRWARSETDGAATEYLRCTNYGFAIPAGATINGITVSVERRSSSTANGGSHDASVRLIKGGVIGAGEGATATIYTTSDVTEAHGGDLWGTTWTAADINAANFGAAFSAIKPGSSGSSHDIYVDHIRITVDYTFSFPPGDYVVTGAPGSCINVGGIGSLAWSNPDRARASDNNRARASTWNYGTTQTNFLQCTGYGFAIPSDAIINGITVSVERRISSTSNASAQDYAMRIVRGGVIGATDLRAAGNYTTSDILAAHGGPTQLWGATWTPADINSGNFGAAFSATITKTSWGTRRVEVDSMPISVSFTVPNPVVNPSAFNAYDTTTLPAGAITGSLTTKTAGQGFAFDIAALNTARDGLLSTYTQTVKVELLDASGGGTLDANNCNAAWSVIATLPNQTFTGNSAAPGSDRATTGAGGRHRVSAVNVAEAWRNVAVRVSYPAAGTATVVGCSTDHFAIRPSSFSGFSVTDEDWQTPGTTRALSNNAASGGVTHKAGQPFTVRATAVNGALATTANYDGTPTGILSSCGGTACTAAFGNFSAGSIPAVSGVFSSNAAVYDEVGSFNLQLQDRTFTNIDAADGSPATCNGRYVCSPIVAVGRFVPDHFAVVAREIVNRADLPVPAATTTTADAAAGDTVLSVLSLTGFTVGTQVRIPGGGTGGNSLRAAVTGAAASTLTLDTPLDVDLPSGSDVFADAGFTYMGEEMRAAFSLIAQAADGSTTSNYDGTLAKLNPVAAGDPLAVGLVDNGSSRTVFPACGGTPAHPCFTAATATGGAFVAGVADDVTVPITVFRGTTAVGACAALDVGLAPVDADGVAMQDYDLDADAAAGDDHALVARTGVRYGRMRLGSGYGSELVPLPLAATVQYWQSAASCATPCGCTAGSFTTSTGDSQTTFLASDVTFSNYRLNLAAGEVAVVTPPASVAFTKGVGRIVLSAPGPDNYGSVDLTTGVPAYLPGNTATAVFGAYKSRLIFRRETY